MSPAEPSQSAVTSLGDSRHDWPGFSQMPTRGVTTWQLLVMPQGSFWGKNSSQKMGSLPRRREGCWQVKHLLEFTHHLATCGLLYISFHFYLSLTKLCGEYTAFITVSIFLMEKMRFRELEPLKQGHRASKWPVQDSNLYWWISWFLFQSQCSFPYTRGLWEGCELSGKRISYCKMVFSWMI